MAKLNRNSPSQSIEQRLYLAKSRWARMRKKENIGLEEGGNKKYLRNQRKYVQKYQRSQGVEGAGRQLCQVITTEVSERSKI